MVQKRASALEKQAKAERHVKLPGSVKGVVDYTQGDSSDLVETIQIVAEAGGALRLGFTRDGGAYAIGIYGDGDPYTVYATPRDDFGEILRGIREGFSNRGV